MFCSILIPSRTRSSHLISAIDSLYQTVAVPEHIEIQVRLDRDDAGSVEELGTHLSDRPGYRVNTMIGDRGRGYADLHLMYNALAAKATGKWLLVFNDDMSMETHGWDAHLMTIDDQKILLVNPADTAGRPTTIHPFIRRDSVNALGHVSLNAYSDAWLQQVYAEAGASADFATIKVRHIRDEMHDEVVESQRQGGTAAWEEFQSEEMKTLRARDVEVLRAFLAAASTSA